MGGGRSRFVVEAPEQDDARRLHLPSNSPIAVSRKATASADRRYTEGACLAATI